MRYKYECIAWNIYLLLFVMCYGLMEISCDDEKTSTTEKISYYLIEAATPLPPPQLSRLLFDGVDYEDPELHLMHQWEPYVTTIRSYLYHWLIGETLPQAEQDKVTAYRRWPCWYEYIRCVRTANYFHYVCAYTVEEEWFNFMSECELDYTNCYLINATYWYVGDGYDCLWHKEYNETNYTLLYAEYPPPTSPPIVRTYLYT